MTIELGRIYVIYKSPCVYRVLASRPGPMPGCYVGDDVDNPRNSGVYFWADQVCETPEELAERLYQTAHDCERKAEEAEKYFPNNYVENPDL